jgi:hypothetical protein
VITGSGSSERDRPDVAWRRIQWTNRQTQIDPARRVFIEENADQDQHGAASPTQDMDKLKTSRSRCPHVDRVAPFNPISTARRVDA